LVIAPKAVLSGGAAILIICTALASSTDVRATPQPPEPAALPADALHAAVVFCRKYPHRIHLSQDRSIACFDGDMLPGRDFSLINGLQEGGRFVVRSNGGQLGKASDPAEILDAKKATVIIYDYCISVCALYLFVASAQTYVVKDTVVAWHMCTISNGTKRFMFAELARKCGNPWNGGAFYAKRAIHADRGVSLPQSPYTRNFAKLAYDVSPGYRDVLWTWNPRYHEQYFKTKIS
jgi:hypothetical protein